MASPCTPKQCRPNERWDASSCACIKSGPKTFKSSTPKLGTTLIPKGKKGGVVKSKKKK
jgi:hypothetical protein